MSVPGKLKSPLAISKTLATHKSGAWVEALTRSPAVTPSNLIALISPSTAAGTFTVTVDSETTGENFLVALVKIIRALQINGDISPQRMCVTCEHFRAHAHQDAANPHHCAFIDMAFGASDLRLNCADHGEVELAKRDAQWSQFLNA